MLHKIWTECLALILRRPALYQVAALCWRPSGTNHSGTGRDTPGSDSAGIEVLLITSLSTKRWVLPKGWPMKGRSGGQAALQEAWEEAGIRIGPTPPHKIGRYRYNKRLRGDVPSPTMVDVYAIMVDRLLDKYPESGLRQRAWYSPEQAAALVEEAELAALLRNLPPLPARQ